MPQFDPPAKTIHEKVRERMAALLSTPEFNQAFEQAKAQGKQLDEASVVRYVTDQLMQEDAVAQGDTPTINSRAINLNKAALRGVTAPLGALERGFNQFAGHFASGTNVHVMQDVRQKLDPSYDPNPAFNAINNLVETGTEFGATGAAMRPAQALVEGIPAVGRAGTALAAMAKARGAGPALQAIAQAAPSEIGTNLAWQGATDPQSLGTPSGMAQGIGFGVLGSLMRGARAAKTPVAPPVADAPVAQPIMNIPDPVLSRAGSPGQLPDVGRAPVPDTRIAPNFMGDRPGGMQGELQPGAELLRGSVARGPQFSYEGEQIPMLSDPEPSRFAPTAPRDPLAGRPVPSAPPLGPQEVPGPDLHQYLLDYAKARETAQAGPPQGPASPPRPDFWDPANPNVHVGDPAARGVPQPDRPFQELYPNAASEAPPQGRPNSLAEPTSAASAASSTSSVSPSVAEEIARLKAENAALRSGEPAPKPVKVTAKGKKAVVATPVRVVAWRDPLSGEIARGEPMENHGMLSDRTGFDHQAAGWERGFATGDQFEPGAVAKAPDGQPLHAADLPGGANERVGFNPKAKATVVSKGKSTVDPLEGTGVIEPAAVDGPGRTFMKEPEFVQRRVEGGNGRREWVPNDNYTRKVKMAQDAGTYESILAKESAQPDGGGPAEGEPFPVKPKRKASTKPRAKRTVKPDPKPPEQG